MNLDRYVVCLLALGLSTSQVRADGGIMRVREAQGPFIITVFSAPELQQDSPVDVSVMVQERDSSDAILDANVKLMFTAPASSTAEPIDEMCGVTGAARMGPDSKQYTVAATRGLASNKLLYAAAVKFDTAGLWQLQAFIEREGDFERIACSIPVSPPARKWVGLFPYLVLPPLLVGLFAVNQWLRGQLRGRAVECTTQSIPSTPQGPLATNVPPPFGVKSVF